MYLFFNQIVFSKIFVLFYFYVGYLLFYLYTF